MIPDMGIKLLNSEEDWKKAKTVVLVLDEFLNSEEDWKE